MLPMRSDRGSAAEVEAERRQRDLEAEQYDRLWPLQLFSRWEIPATLGPLQVGGEDRVLEVGCGTGRMTLRLLGRCRELIAVDHSLESLRVLRRKLPSRAAGPMLLIQGDATRLPIRSGWASRALSCQMLEHLPTPEMRREAVVELGRVLRRGGRAALSGYWYPPGLGWLLKREGKHSGAIFFHRFTHGEFRALLEPELRIEQLTARLVYVLLAHARRR